MAAGGATLRFNQGALDRLLASEAGPVGRLVLRATLAVERQAKHNAHVITGRMRAAIQSRLERQAGEVVGIVSCGVNYAPYEEFKPGHAFLRPALDAARGVV